MDFVELSWILVVTLLGLLIFFFAAVFKRQSQAMAKFNQSLRNQDMVLKRFDAVLKELRHANRFLSELAAVEWTDEAPMPVAHAQPFDESTATHAHEETSSTTGNEHKLYVGNIDYAVTEPELAEHFAAYGEVEGVNIPVNRYNGRARGFGFVTFSSREEAEKAMELNGTVFKGRQIQVNFAKERESGA